MQLTYALKYIFDDKDWPQKLLILAGIGLISLILLFGLIAAAFSLGFLLQLARNVRQGAPLPLPKWNDWQTKFEIGGQLLLAMLLYHLPLILLFICLSSSVSGLGVALMGDFIAYGFALCCFMPLIIIYTIIIWPLLAIGVAEFIETNEPGRFFRLFHQWEVLQNNVALSSRWLLFTLLINAVLLMFILIPCLGWLIILIFGYPVLGHLLGQFAHQLSLTNKPQAAPRKPAPQRPKR
jgi:hypothetical protein